MYNQIMHKSFKTLTIWIRRANYLIFPFVFIKGGADGVNRGGGNAIDEKKVDTSYPSSLPPSLPTP